MKSSMLKFLRMGVSGSALALALAGSAVWADQPVPTASIEPEPTLTECGFGGEEAQAPVPTDPGAEVSVMVDGSEEVPTTVIEPVSSETGEPDLVIVDGSEEVPLQVVEQGQEPEVMYYTMAPELQDVVPVADATVQKTVQVKAIATQADKSDRDLGKVPNLCDTAGPGWNWLCGKRN